MNITMESSFITTTDPLSLTMSTDTPVKTYEIIGKNKQIYLNEFKKCNRYIAISFSFFHDMEKKITNIKYGASIYLKENNNEKFNKKYIMKTADERFEKFPVLFHIDFENDLPLKFGEIVKKIRKTMMTNGCCTRKK